MFGHLDKIEKSIMEGFNDLNYQPTKLWNNKKGIWSGSFIRRLLWSTASELGLSKLTSKKNIPIYTWIKIESSIIDGGTSAVFKIGSKFLIRIFFRTFYKNGFSELVIILVIILVFRIGFSAFHKNGYYDEKNFNFEKEELTQLLEVATTNQLFQFDGQLYEQTDGIAMGSPLGPLMANVFMHQVTLYFLSTWLSSWPHKFHHWYVYSKYCN